MSAALMALTSIDRRGSSVDAARTSVLRPCGKRSSLPSDVKKIPALASGIARDTAKVDEATSHTAVRAESWHPQLAARRAPSGEKSRPRMPCGRRSVKLSRSRRTRRPPTLAHHHAPASSVRLSLTHRADRCALSFRAPTIGWASRPSDSSRDSPHRRGPHRPSCRISIVCVCCLLLHRADRRRRRDEDAEEITPVVPSPQGDGLARSMWRDRLVSVWNGCRAGCRRDRATAWALPLLPACAATPGHHEQSQCQTAMLALTVARRGSGAPPAAVRY